jgi:glycosyltransferase involved in cell wall biosynthesis
MKISLIHPSKGRPKKSFDNVTEWLSKASSPDDIEIIVSIDKDIYINDYEMVYAPMHNRPIGELGFAGCGRYRNGNFVIAANPNRNVVEATNIACKYATGDILIYFSDDFKSPDNWDELIIKQFEGENRPLLLKVDDCLQGFDVPVLTIPIMNRALYERLGYFFHPEYKSMFCDEHLYWVTRKLGAIKNAAHLKFPHEHVSIGKAQDDETYRNSAKNWDQGKALFAKHKAQGFPV